MAFPSAPSLCRHRLLATNQASPVVGRAFPADVHVIDGQDAAAYSPVYHKVVDHLADYTSAHEDFDCASDCVVVYVDD